MATKSFRERSADLAKRVAPQASPAAETEEVTDNPSLATKVARLTRRVAELEAELQETRQLNVRVAELTDVVQELLLPISQRDEAQIKAVLQRYAETI